MGISQKTLQEICNRAYPVGSYYFSNSSTSPVTLFGGTWTQISGYFVKAMSSSIGSTGGSSSQNVNFCPTHSHTISSHTHTCISHTHSISSVSHSHTVNTHSHSNSTSQGHGHSYRIPQSPPGTEVGNGTISAATFAGSYYTCYISSYSVFTTNKTDTSISLSTSSASLGSATNNSSSLNSTTLTSTSYGSSGSSISIMPPYKECYCWRRTG